MGGRRSARGVATRSLAAFDTPAQPPSTDESPAPRTEVPPKEGDTPSATSPRPPLEASSIASLEARRGRWLRERERRRPPGPLETSSNGP